MSAVARRLVVAAAVLGAATPALAAKKPLASGERVDLNRATVQELMRLPGVGLRKAQAIVAHRQKTPFRKPEEVMRVKGCGRLWFQRVKAHLAVAGAPAAPASSAPAPVAPTPRPPAATTPPPAGPAAAGR